MAGLASRMSSLLADLGGSEQTAGHIALCALCLAVGWVAGRSASADGAGALGGSCSRDDDGHGAVASVAGDVKMVLCVRTDLKMSKGKIAAQCGHAALGMYMKLQTREKTLLQNWFASGQAKVALKVESEVSMLELRSAASTLGLPVHIVVDAGRTQIEPNTRTVLAILGPKDTVDAVTGRLSLL